LKTSFYDFPLYKTSSFDKTALKGDGKKKLLIVINDENLSNEENLLFLEKIIAAIKYSLREDAYYIYTNDDEKIMLSEIVSIHEISSVLVFGIDHHALGIHVNQKKYQPFVLQQTTYLFADNLTEVQSQKEFKGALWDALKRIFLS
jgi:hypothetical protein